MILDEENKTHATQHYIKFPYVTEFVTNRHDYVQDSTECDLFEFIGRYECHAKYTKYGHGGAYVYARTNV